jgi:peptide/nickel transport system permease protein
MYSYIVRRLGFGALTVLGVSIIVFIILRILPGDPLVAISAPRDLPSSPRPNAPITWPSWG